MWQRAGPLQGKEPFLSAFSRTINPGIRTRSGGGIVSVLEDAPVGVSGGGPAAAAAAQTVVVELSRRNRVLRKFETLVIFKV